MMTKHCCLALLLVLPFMTWISMAQEPAPYTEIKDLLYVDAAEDDSLQRLNLVLPRQAEPARLLLWIGGGAWSYVDRHMEMDFARRVAGEGIAVAAVGHRLSAHVWQDPEATEGVQHPAHIEDIAAAFRWLYDHAETYGYDRDAIYVGGYSSGGHLAALLSMDSRYLEAQGLTTANIRGVIPIAGTYDIANYHEAFATGSRPELAEQHVEAVFGDSEADFLDASPTTYVDALATSMLLISEQASYGYTSILEDRILDTDFRDYSVFHIPRIGHGPLWRHLSYEEDSIYRALIVDFIRS